MYVQKKEIEQKKMYTVDAFIQGGFSRLVLHIFLEHHPSHLKAFIEAKIRQIMF